MSTITTQKKQLEHEIDKRSAAHKYWETHDVDPMTSKYVHPDKEAAALAAEAEDQLQQPMKAFNKLPPALQKGEGFVYDITSPALVKNQELYDKTQAAEKAWLERKKETWNRETMMTQRGIADMEMDAQRTQNRASHTRYFETYGNGYNIVDHRDYQDPTTYMAPARTRAPETVWQKVERAPVVAKLATIRQPEPSRQPQCLASTALSTEPAAVRTGGFQRMSAAAPSAES